MTAKLKSQMANGMELNGNGNSMLIIILWLSDFINILKVH